MGWASRKSFLDTYCMSVQQVTRIIENVEERTQKEQLLLQHDCNIGVWGKYLLVQYARTKLVEKVDLIHGLASRQSIRLKKGLVGQITVQDNGFPNAERLVAGC